MACAICSRSVNISSYYTDPHLCMSSSLRSWICCGPECWKTTKRTGEEFTRYLFSFPLSHLSNSVSIPMHARILWNFLSPSSPQNKNHNYSVPEFVCLCFCENSCFLACMHGIVLNRWSSSFNVLPIRTQMEYFGWMCVVMMSHNVCLGPNLW